MIHDQRAVDEALRLLLQQGFALGDALRQMHAEQQQGLLFLVPAVVAVTGMERAEARRVVVHEIGG
jgi:hypothetical protein